MRSLGILIFILSVVVACTKKDPIPTPLPFPDTTTVPIDKRVYNPTPHTLVYPFYFSTKTAPADNPTTKEGIELGRMLFYEKMLSGNNTISCATCHQQQYAFTDGKAFSTGIDGIQGKRSAMAVQNMMWVSKLFWDGRANSLEQQALMPIQDPIEMHQSLGQSVSKIQNSARYKDKFFYAFGSDTVTSERIAKAIAQFERTLISANSKYDKYLRGEYTLTAQEDRGMQLFFTHPIPDAPLRGGNCGDCHGGYMISLDGFHNNGLDQFPTDSGRGKVTGNSFDNFKMRAPSLRNIELTAPYMHDGRFATLEEVLSHYNEHINTSSPNIDPLVVSATNEVGGTTLMLTAQEKADIISFLKLLTDTDFVTNPEHSDPF